MNKDCVIYIVSAVILLATFVYYAFTAENRGDDIAVEVFAPISETSVSDTSCTVTAKTVKTTVQTTVRTTAVKTTVLKTTAVEPSVTEVSEITEEVTDENIEIQEEQQEVLWIDINTATAEELVKLKGIGEVTAENIVNYRNSHGGFRNIEELMSVSGIGEVTFSDIKDFVYVVSPVYETETVQEFSEEIPVQEVQVQTETITEHIKTLEECVPININTADVDELMLLPYVDLETAEEIVKIRNEIGGFSHVYELLYVRKLTQKQTAEIVEFVTIEQQ